ncbi:uncharacterized protein LOC126616944 [Malus sylvestris]|uniref:uncharacterized protein LOC126616944 n=1 Tax=Malus sylvestris TaxID=3752 RepID=UPI0021ABCAD2|nr:uncharacterized protein LOC126616944 [Malus sylvestris]
MAYGAFSLQFAALDVYKATEFVVVSVNTRTAQSRNRGAAIPKWKERQLCSFDSTRKCVSANATEFSELITFKVKDPRNLPLKRDWRLIRENDKEGNIIFLYEDYDKMPLIRNMTLHVADNSYKEYQNGLKAEYYTKRQEHERSEPPPGVDVGQWIEMKVAEKNKFNGELKTMNHTIGSKTFARVHKEYKNKHGKESNPILFFF